MRLRIQFKSVDSSQVESALLYTNIDTLSVKIDGVESIGSVVSEDTDNVARFDITLSNPEDTAEVEITATDEGYTYYNKFNVYGYDLGNSSTITTNDDFIIYIVKSNVITYSKFIQFRKPFSNDILLYNATSSVFDTLQYLDTNDNVLSIIGNSIISSEQSIGIKLFKSNTYLSGETFLTSTDTSSVVTINTFTWLLDYEVQIEYPFNTGNLTNQLATNTARALIYYDNLDTYNIDDVVQYPYNQEKITYNLFNSNGDLENTSNFTLDINNPPFIHNPLDPTYEFTFNTTAIGDFLLQVQKTMINYSAAEINTYNQSVGVKSDEYYLVSQVYSTCEYTFTNKALPVGLIDGSLFIDVYKYDTSVGESLSFDTSTPIVDNYEVTSQASYSIALPNDGVYQLRVKRPLVAEPGTDYSNTEEWEIKYSLLINYCSSLKCYESIQKKLICEDNCDKCNDEINYDFNRIKAVFEIFTLYVNSAQVNQQSFNADYTLDKIHTPLDNSTLADFYTVQQIIERLTEYCARCRDEVINPGDCGCS